MKKIMKVQCPLDPGHNFTYKFIRKCTIISNQELYKLKSTPQSLEEKLIIFGFTLEDIRLYGLRLGTDLVPLLNK